MPQAKHNLISLHIQEVIVGQLMKRYCKDLIYTYVGDVLVSINPFQNLPDMYDPKVESDELHCQLLLK